jgi:uncharacterized protein (DUF4415 family)
MSKQLAPADFDENPEWTEDDFARSQLGSEVLPAALLAAFGSGKRGRPIGSTKAVTKKMISLRLDPDVIEGFRRTGPGWQARMNETLRAALVTG